MSGGSVHLGRLGAGLDHFGQHLALLRGIALHRLNQIGNEVGAALILVQHLAPSGLGLLLQRGDGVDAAAGKRQPGDRQSQRTDENARTRTRRCQHDSLPEQPKNRFGNGCIEGAVRRQGLLPDGTLALMRPQICAPVWRRARGPVPTVARMEQGPSLLATVQSRSRAAYGRRGRIFLHDAESCTGPWRKTPGPREIFDGRPQMLGNQKALVAKFVSLTYCDSRGKRCAAEEQFRRMTVRTSTGRAS